MGAPSLKKVLADLYYDQSKHSVYQTLPGFVEEAFGFNFEIDQQWRGDHVRFEYLRGLCDWSGKRVIDIGANTGYFGLNLAHEFTCEVTCYEANESHCRLIERIAAHFQMDRVRVDCQALGAEQVSGLGRADVALLFNVLHHAGHDFDRGRVNSQASVAEYCVRYLSALRERVSTLVFQMGYNWGGNKSLPIVPVTDARGFFTYQMRLLSQAGWRVDRVGMAYRDTSGTSYQDLNLAAVEEGWKPVADADARVRLTRGLEVQDGMSEFYRRPIFLCQSDETSTPGG